MVDHDSDSHRADDHGIEDASSSDALNRLRELCLALPGATEKLSHGEPTWFVRKVFVMFAGRHHDDRVAFWCPAPPGVQEALVADEPARFFRPPYVGHRGWLGVYLDVPGADWAEVAEIVTDVYREVAPARVAARLKDVVPPGATVGSGLAGDRRLRACEVGDPRLRV